MSDKTLIVFAAHIDDVELAFWGYMSKHYDEYKKIKIIIATDWEPKRDVWNENLERMKDYIAATTVPHRFDVIEYVNLGYEARKAMTDFDSIKDDFYKLIDFDKRFDILTHDDKDCHTDHFVRSLLWNIFHKLCSLCQKLSGLQESTKVEDP